MDYRRVTVLRNAVVMEKLEGVILEAIYAWQTSRLFPEINNRWI